MAACAFDRSGNTTFPEPDDTEVEAEGLFVDVLEHPAMDKATMQAMATHRSLT